MEMTVDGRTFATPRGWEDLSTILQVYDKLGKEMDREVIVQYIQHERIAKDFANYLELYRKYQMDYQLDAVLEGRIDDILIKKASHASFDEKLSVVSLLLSRCRKRFADLMQREHMLELVFENLKVLKEGLLDVHSSQPIIYFQEILNAFTKETEQKKQAELLTRSEEYDCRKATELLEKYLMNLQKQDVCDGETAFDQIKDWFDEEQDAYDAELDASGQMLENAFEFIEEAFGTGQEMVIFITELNTDFYSVKFLQQYECERYYRYNKNLLFEEGSKSIEARLKALGK